MSALGLFALGCVCMHELYEMYARARPVRLAGFIGLAGLLAAALYGDQAQVLLAAVAALPVLFALTLMQPRPSVGGMALTLLGIYWIGFALAIAVLLRGLPHGLGIVIDILVGTFLGDTGAYLGGQLFGRRPLAPRISQQDRRGAADRGGLRGARRVDRGALSVPGCRAEHALVLGVGVALGGAGGRPFRVVPEKREGCTPRTPARCSAPMAGALDRLDAALFAIVVGYVHLGGLCPRVSAC